MSKKLKYPALKGARRFVVVASNEVDCREKFTALKSELEKKGWECRTYPPPDFPSVLVGYQDSDGWQVVCEAYFRDGEIVAEIQGAFNKYSRTYVKRYPKDSLAGAMLGQTRGTAEDRLNDLSWIKDK